MAWPTKSKYRLWMGKHEISWDLYELWMLNIDRDNQAFKKLEETKSDSLSDAVTKPTAPYTDMTFGMGKTGYPAICMTQLSAKCIGMVKCKNSGGFIASQQRPSGNMPAKREPVPLTILEMIPRSCPNSRGI